jgi:hypothetical protein
MKMWISEVTNLIWADVFFDISISLGFLISPGARWWQHLYKFPDINTLLPIAFQTELTSNIGRDIDLITDTKRQAGLHFCHGI